MDGRSFRWKAPLLIPALALLALPGLAVVLGFYRVFSVPAESMEPTLPVGSRLIGQMGDTGELRRGDLVLIKTRDDIYIKRIAALPGDRIALEGGRIILNGVAVEQRRDGEYRVTSEPDTAAARFSEQFPGEAAPHAIVDLRVSAQDDFPESAIPKDRYFLLGDNRDNSADSRFSGTDFGLGLVRRDQIIGRVWKLL